jgi:S-adenosylmethionine synthetase
VEAAAGKNPVTHAGKIYNIVAQRIATAVVQEIAEVEEAQCYLVSRIGHPIDEPQVVDLRLQIPGGASEKELKPRVQDIVLQHLSSLSQIRDQLIAGAIKVY